MVLTVTVRSEANVLVDLIIGSVVDELVVASITPFFSVHVPLRIVQSVLEGLLLSITPGETTFTVNDMLCESGRSLAIAMLMGLST